MGNSGTPIPVLSAEQERILRPGSLLIEACPGAGKTHAIVARYLHSASSSSQGTALLSFTNRAIGEIRQRCAAHPSLLRSPNFVGTIDAFLRDFIVSPHVGKTLQLIPRYLLSWRELEGEDHCVRLRGGPSGPGVSLESFVRTPEGLVPGELGYTEASYYAWVERTGRKGVFAEAAARKRRSLMERGLFDTDAARQLASEILAAEQGAIILRRLALRFREIIVDEFQDCDEHEHAVLGHLAAAGITIVAVADPDQAIYAFRGARPDLIATYAAALDPESIVSFDTNYRSTQAICDLASSLRMSATPITAATTGSEPDTIFVLGGTVEEQRASFAALLERYRITPGDALVLAHRRSDAIALAGAAVDPKPGQARGNRIAVAAAVLSQPHQSPETKRAALRELEVVVLSLFAWPVELRNAATGARVIRLGKSPEWLRTLAIRLMKAAWSVVDHDQFGPVMRALLDQELRDAAIPHLDLATNVRKPDRQSWERLAGTATRTVSALSFDTIHSAKGGERDAICLYIPPRRGGYPFPLDDWQNGQDSEARRVLYVGATRARRLLALAVAPTVQEQLRAILVREGVKHTVVVR